MNRIWSIFLILILPAIQEYFLYGQETIPLVQLAGPVIIDGYSEEPAWEAIPVLPATMYQPIFRGTMTERTEFLVAYDSDFIYIAGRFYDSDPEGILASALYRDGGTSADDYFNVVLDPYNDNENARWFWTTPAGIRGDMAISNDMVGDQAMNQSWNTFWEVATQQNEAGWFAEIRIPFSSLGFQVEEGQVTMGLTLSRAISRKNEHHVFPAVSPEWNRGFAKPSVAQDVRLQGLSSRKPVYLTPYLLGGGTRLTLLNPVGTAYQYRSNFARDAGLDLKYNVTNNLSLNLTVDTDFAQVEADNQQVNLTRFSLFFPEKRQFFQERAGLFNYFFGFQERLFHSRQIGLSNGQPIRILGGARLVGRIRNWDLGFMNMQTARHADQAAENFGVFRCLRPSVDFQISLYLRTWTSFVCCAGIPAVWPIYPSRR